MFPYPSYNSFDDRLKRLQNTCERDLLVLWEGLPELEATWEDYGRKLRTFPNAHIEDKVELQAKCIATLPGSQTRQTS